MPIHDQGYRRYGGSAHRTAGAWWVIARAGMLAAVREAAFHRAAAVRLGRRSSSAPCRSMSRRTSSRRRSWRRRRRRSASSSISRSIFVFFVTHLRRRRADRRRSPRQRAAALSVEAADPRRVHRRQAGDAALVFLRCVTGCRRCCCCCCRCCSPAAPTFLRSNLFLMPAITLFSAVAGLRLGVHDAGAVVAVEEPPVRRDDVCRHRLLHRRPVSGAARHHRQPRLGVRSRPATRWTSIADGIFRIRLRRRPFRCPCRSRLLVIVVLIAASHLGARAAGRVRWRSST